ncbi:hypothetical protein IV203_031730 [Nitzschia inconspicua]|uniref:Uncharacterized protein n=1 Tax=Nitzschia inconspicua TaxID=303405 RepID=A0A9K3LVF1_9STRA|nr:hypothetical protein IV203_031730 [Nitzschia inconspicua]
MRTFVAWLSFLELLLATQSESEQLCDKLLKKLAWGCSCTDILEDGGNNTNGQVAFHCEMCDICDVDMDDDICVKAEYAHIIDYNSDAVTHRTKFRYSTGNQTDEILLEQDCSLNENLDLTCSSSCVASVNNETCNSCEVLPTCDKDSILPFTSIPKFDCSNMEEGAVYDPCTENQQQHTSHGDLLFGSELAIENCLRTVTPDSLPEEATAKCSAAIKLEPGMDHTANYFDELVEIRGICNSVGYYSAAKFYKVTGNGNIFTASTCREGTTRLGALSVFSGGCDNLVCTENQSHQWPLCGDEYSFLRYSSDEVSWKTEVDEEYYILVMATEAGDIQVGLTETVPPTNTECEAADTDSLIPDGPPVNGNTVAGGTGPSCDLFTHGEEFPGRGVWYRIFPEQGNQTVFIASTCSSTTTNFAAEIRVFSGACGSLTCVEDSLYETCEGGVGGSRVSWSTSSEIETYFIYVTSPFIEELGGAGIFSLSLSELEVAPNSDCIGAIPVDVGGDKVVGSTVAVAGSGFLPSLQMESDILLIAQPGVWYSVTHSSASTLQVSTCFQETEANFVALIWIYKRGDNEACNGMELIAMERGNDPDCVMAIGSKVTWAAEEGVEYLIFISSESARGEFAFSISETQSPINDRCESADSSLSIDGAPVAGSTLSATRDFPLDASCGNTSFHFPGVWYTIQGNGKSLSATTCSWNLNFAAKITLFEGTSCEDLTCVDSANTNDNWRCSSESNGSSSTINWKSEVNKTYFLYIHGGDPLSIGDFELSVSELPQTPENNFCSQASSITATEEVSGSTADAAIGLFNGGYCGGAIENGGIWFELEGTGESIELTGCSFGDDYHLTVSVFEGSCNNLTCVTGETFPIACIDSVDVEPSKRELQTFKKQREITWFAEAGVSYKLYVHGQAPNLTLEGGTGSFELIIGVVPTEEPKGTSTGSPIVLDTFPPDPTESPTIFPTVQLTFASPTDLPSALYETTADNPDSEALSQFRMSMNIVMWSMIGSLYLLLL